MLNPQTFASVVDQWTAEVGEIVADITELSAGVREQSSYTNKHSTEMVDSIAERLTKAARAFRMLEPFTRGEELREYLSKPRREEEATASVKPGSTGVLHVDWDDLPVAGSVCLTVSADGQPLSTIYVSEVQLKMILGGTGVA